MRKFLLNSIKSTATICNGKESWSLYGWTLKVLFVAIFAQRNSKGLKIVMNNYESVDTAYIIATESASIDECNNILINKLNYKF